tara:strand:+ start:4889 stop:7468 length:2580 start_codon:yes stop_codon:yes gene_type:complete
MFIKFYRTILLLTLLSFISSCSTKKKSWVNKQYHNTTARYNGYFNGNESLKKGVKRIHLNHKDDYTSILPVYKEIDLKNSNTQSYMDKAIKKGSVVIQRHSMKIRGKEYCKWIDDSYFLVGKAYFYKGEFQEAIKTFTFIIEEYKKNEIRFYATLWLIRSHLELENYTQAEMLIEELENERNKPKKFDVKFGFVKADHYLKQNNLSLALEELKALEKITKRKKNKVRINFIIAQIYQFYDNFKQATFYYQKTLKLNPEYEMAFNSKMNLARSSESGSKLGQKAKASLLKMLKDEKNKDYLDQIYYTLAEISLNIADTNTAKENYLLSTKNSVNNNAQKALSFLSLAKIDYAQRNYIETKKMYDSTVFYLSEEHRNYIEANQNQQIFTDLAYHINIVELEDSLQYVALLPENEKRMLIQNIIQKEIERERQEKEQRQQVQSLLYQNSRNNTNQFGNNTSAGKWYFYNPSTLSFGMSEFRKKWGKRKLEDDWRRKDKKTLNIILEQDSLIKDSVNNGSSKNKKSPEFYLSQLPKSKEDFDESNNKIKESLYQMAIIFRDVLFENEISIKTFLRIVEKYPNDESYSSLALYNTYYVYLDIKKSRKAQETKSELLAKYPNSMCAKILSDTILQASTQLEKLMSENKYDQIFSLYKAENYEGVFSYPDTVIKKENIQKYWLIKAMSHASIKDTLNAKIELQKIINSAIDEDIKNYASKLLDKIQNPQKITDANDLSTSDFSYLYKPNSKHICVVILDKNNLNINYFKTLISDFNLKKYENDVFEIGAMLYALDKHLVTIKSFENSEKALLYKKKLKKGVEIENVLSQRKHKIFVVNIENFQKLYTTNDADEYLKFYKKYYNLKN